MQSSALDNALFLGVLLASGAMAAWLDRAQARRGLTPPAWQPASFPGGDWSGRLQRGAAAFLIAFCLALTVFSPLLVIGDGAAAAEELDASEAQLFLVHVLLALTLAIWCQLAYRPSIRSRTSWWAQLGWRCARPGREIALGLVLGVVIWFFVLLLLAFVAVTLQLLGMDRLLPSAPPPMVEWMASRGFWVRAGVALSAGVVEETFFRGFLQPRCGVPLSTALFVLAHTSYEQPLLLLGVAVLSLAFARLTRWRRSIWAAATAHFVFDAMQLLVVVPLASGG